MQTRNALSNLKNRYKAVLKKCHILNTFGSLALFSLLTLSAGLASADFAHSTSLNEAVLSENISLYELNADELISSSLDSMNGTSLIIDGKNFSISSDNDSTGISLEIGQTLTVSNLANWSGFYTHSYGALFNNDGTINLNNSLFSNNHARGGGGVLYNTGNANLFSTTFNDNYAYSLNAKTYLDGGAIYNTGIIDILSSYFNDNIGRNGGALYNSGKATITNSHFTGNKATHGSAIHNTANATLDIDTSTFTHNSRREDNALTGYAYGTIYNAGTATIKNTIFSENSAGAGGALYNAGIMTIEDSKFIKNESRTGGAINTEGYQSTLTIRNSTFDANSGGYNGAAAIRSTNSNVFIYGSVFENHYEVNTNLSQGEPYYDRENGGVIYHYDPGYARDEEGNITGFLDTPGILYIKDTIFRNNTVGRGGGAIYNCGQAILENVTFENNSSDLTHGPAGTGGAFYNYNRLSYFYDDKNSVIRNSIFRNNSAYSAGAIYHAIGTLEVYDTLFDGNKGIPQGIAGGLYGGSDTTLLVHDSRFINNYSGLGAALGSGRAHIEVNNSHFENNTAEYTGSAIHVRYVTPQENEEVQVGGLYVDDTTFTKNNAGTGTIYIEANINLDVKNSEFIENTGGGITNYGFGTISDTLFSKNIDGSAIHNRGDSSLIISNTTFEYGNNSAVNNSGYMEIYDSEFIGNIVSMPTQNYVYSGAFNNIQDGEGAVVKNTVFLNNITQHSDKIIQYQGGAINSRYDLDIVADGGDVLFSGNLSNETPNALVGSNSDLNLYANKNSSFIINESILLRVDAELNINNTANTKDYITDGVIEINDKIFGLGSYLDRFNVNLYDGTLKLGTKTVMYDIDANGSNETEITSSGTLASNVNFNVYGGALSTVDSQIHTTNLGNISLHNDLNWDLDVDLKEEKADTLTANSASHNDNNILINSLNVLSLGEENVDVQVTNDRDLLDVIKLGLGRFTLEAGILAKENDFTAVSYDNTTGNLQINTSIEEENTLKAMVDKDSSDKAYIMQADEIVVENLGNLQGTRLNITANNNSILAEGTSGIIVSNNQELALFDVKNWSGFSSENGGALYNAGLITIENVNFTNNSAQVAGAAIYNTNDGIINITAGNQDLIFNNNNVLADNTIKSEAIYNDGQINLYSSGTNSIISYDTFAGNGIYNIYGALNLQGNNAQVAENSTLNVASSQASISTLDNAIGITSLGKLQASNGFKLFVDVALDLDNPENTTYDQFTLSGLAENSNFTLGAINLLDFTQGLSDTSGVLDFFIGANSDALALNSADILDLKVYGSDYDITYSSNDDTKDDLNDIIYNYDLYSDPGIVNTLNSVLSETTSPRQYIMEEDEDALEASVIGDMTVLGNTHTISAGTISIANSANNILTLNNTNTAEGTTINLLAAKQANKNTLNIIASADETIINNSDISGKAIKHNAINIYGDGKHIFNGDFNKTTMNIAAHTTFAGNIQSSKINMLDGSYNALIDNISLSNTVDLNLYGSDSSKINSLTLEADNLLLTDAVISSANNDNILNLKGLGSHEISSNLSNLSLNVDAATKFKGNVKNVSIDASKALIFDDVALDKSVSIATSDDIEIFTLDKITTRAYFDGNNEVDAQDNTITFTGLGMHIINGATFKDIDVDFASNARVKSATFENSNVTLLADVDFTNSGSFVGGSILANAGSKVSLGANATFSDTSDITMKADSVLNTKNNAIDIITLNNFTAEKGSELRLDIDLSTATSDTFKVNSSSGSIKLDNVRLLGELAPDAHKNGTLQIFEPSSLDIDLKKITYYTPLQKVIITQNDENNGSINYNADYRYDTSIAAALLNSARDSHVIYELVGSEAFNTVTETLEGVLTVVGKGQTLTGDGYQGGDGSEVNFEDVGVLDVKEIVLGTNSDDSSSLNFENTSSTTTTIINSNILSHAVSNVVSFGAGIFKTFGIFDPLEVDLSSEATLVRANTDSAITYTIEGNLSYEKDEFLYDSSLEGKMLGLAAYARNSLNFNGGSLNTINNVATPHMKIDTFSLAANTNSYLSLDVDLANKKMDSFDANTMSVGANAKLTIDTLNLVSELPSTTALTLNFTNNTDLQNAIVLGSTPLIGYSPIYEYLVSYEAGNFTFSRNNDAYNPLVLSSLVGLSAYANASIDNSKRTLNQTNLTYLPSGFGAGSESSTSLLQSAWVDVYGSIENTTFNGLDVDNEQYGFIGGINSAQMSLGSFDSVYSLFLGSTNSTQEYNNDDIDIEQHGFMLGVGAAFSKANFFTKTNVNFGFSHTDAHSNNGDENYNTYSFSLFNKSGLSFESENGFFAFEPSITFGYSYISNSDYTNALGSKIESDAWHIFTLNPELKASLNFENGMSTYASLGYNFNFDSNGTTKANEIQLPELAADQYAEFKLGLKANLSQNFNTYFEVSATAGDRESVSGQLGFKYSF